MNKITYQGSFRIDVLHDELLAAGIAIVTISGNINRIQDLSSPDTTIQIYTPDQVQEGDIRQVVALHQASAVDAQRQAERLRIAQNTTSAQAKLRAFYTSTVGLSDEEIDDTKLLELT